MRALIFLFLVLIRYSTTAQSTIVPSPAAGLKYRLTYTLEETSFFKPVAGAPTSTLSPLDIEKTQPITVMKDVEVRITDDYNYSTTITITNPEIAYAEFPTKIGRIEINQAGIQIYDPTGALYLDTPADSTYEAEYSATKSLLETSAPNIMQSFPTMPSAAEIQAIITSGGSFNMLANNTWQISNNTNQVLYDPVQNRITSTRYEDNNVKETRIQHYAYNTQGVYAPSIDITKKPVVRPSGACMEDVVRKKYTNYTVAISPQYRNEYGKATQHEETIIWPNPASDKLFIATGAKVVQGSALQVFNLVGEIVYTHPSLKPNIEVEIPIGSWADGVYFVRLETTSGIQTQKFIKKSE